MKLAHVENFEAEDVRLELSISLDKSPATYSLQYSYTCPECGGHGCRYRNNECTNGSVYHDLDDLKHASEIFSAKKAEELAKLLQKLQNSLLPDLSQGTSSIRKF